MIASAQAEKAAKGAAEQVLRHLFGDESSECRESLDEIARIVLVALTQYHTRDRELLQLYDRAMESVSLLASAPGGDGDRALAADAELRQRLEAIRIVAAKTLETAELFKE